MSIVIAWLLIGAMAPMAALLHSLEEGAVVDLLDLSVADLLLWALGLSFWVVAGPAGVIGVWWCYERGRPA